LRKKVQATSISKASLAEIVDKVISVVMDIINMPCIEVAFPEDLRRASNNSIEYDRGN
jgi:hypothetical protein